MDDNWVRVLKESDVEENKMRAVYPLGLGVLMSKIGGEILAVLNRCPHMGCPLSAGSFKEGVVTCACHEWRFDLKDGLFLDAPEIRLPVFDTKVEGGDVFVRLEEVI